MSPSPPSPGSGSRALAGGALAGSAPHRSGRAGLRLKFVLLVGAGFVATGLALGWAFSRQAQAVLRSEFHYRGETLALSVAANVRRDVRAGNAAGLSSAVAAAREPAEVVSASVYGARREVLARSEIVAGTGREPPPPVPRSVVVETRSLPGGGRAVSFLAPVELPAQGGRGPEQSAERRGAAGGGFAPTEPIGAVEIVLSRGGLESRIARVNTTAIVITGGIVAAGLVLMLVLSGIFVAPIEHLAEIEAKQQELIAANAELARASRLKSEFIAKLAHELRTPLNAVNGFSELLLEETHGPLAPRQRRHVENILSCGRELLQLIDDSLDLAKIEAGRMDLRVEEFSLRQTIESAASVIRPLAQKKGLAVEVTVEPGLDRVELDAAKTRQILYNLLSNAVKFTAAGGVSVLARRAPPAGASAEVVVADTGIGIRPEDQSRIFREFERVDGLQARGEEGTGLGLALTRRLVELQGGEIRVESEFGRGSRFIVRLPLRAAVAVASSR